MAGEGISIDIHANVNGAVAGVGDVQVALSRAETAVEKFSSAATSGGDDAVDAFADVITELVKLGRVTGKTREEIVRDLGKIGLSAEDAEDAVAAIERETSDLGSQAPRDLGKTEDAVKDLGDAAEEAGDKTATIKDKAGTAGDGLRDLGQVAKDVMSGDFAGAAQSALDSLGGLAAAAGLGGAVGGAVSSAIAGLVSALIKEWSAWSEKVKETRDELVQALIDTGGAFEQAQIESRIRDIAGDTEKWAQANLIAQTTGRDVSDVLLTLAGVTGDADGALKDWNDSLSKIPGNVPLDLIRDTGAALQGVSEAADGAPERIDAVKDAMGRVKGEAKEADKKIDDLRNQLLNPLPDPPPVKLRVDSSGIDAALRRIPTEVNVRVNAIVRPGTTQAI